MQLLKTDDGSYTLLDPDQQETYHSKFGALTESDQVYLHNSGVYQRLQAQQPTSILEIGFGTGFNFVHTAQHALKWNCELHYTACEMLPVSREIALEVLKHNAPEANDLCEFTADAIGSIATANRPANQPPNQSVNLALNSRTHLHLHRVDARSHSWPAAAFDAIYLDAFSKKNNPSLWSADFLKKLRAASKPDTRLATYCVNGEFRTALTAAGFSFRKLPGPKGKREVLVATPLPADQIVDQYQQKTDI